MYRIWNRIANEPVLVTGAILAAGNLVGADLTELASLVESAVVLAATAVARHFVSPVRTIDGPPIPGIDD